MLDEKIHKPRLEQVELAVELVAVEQVELAVEQVELAVEHVELAVE